MSTLQKPQRRRHRHRRADDALEQMDYGMTMAATGELWVPAPTPATFAIDGDNDTGLDVDALERVLDEHGYGMVGLSTGERTPTGFYCFTDVRLSEDGKRVGVKAWADVAMIFPKQQLPGRGELARVIDAIEAGAGGELRHDLKAFD